MQISTLLVAADGSGPSNAAGALAVELAARAGARLCGVHVYAAKLHDRRFRQMEAGLPEAYQQETELQRQRDIHGELIGRGLKLISASYLQRLAEQAQARGVDFEARDLEGRNWSALLQHLGLHQPDLLLMGATGLGAVPGVALGGMAERVLRGAELDALVVRQPRLGRLGVAVDGSARSLGALEVALQLAQQHGCELELMSSFDPHFHHHVFQTLRGVLSEDASRVFRFEEQEQLHDEIIDAGLAKIYQGHLAQASRIATDAGVEAPAQLYAGKAALAVRRFVEERGIDTLFVGRTGVHGGPDLDLGAVPLALLRAGGPNLYLAARAVDPALHQDQAEPLRWTEEAEARLQRAPGFVQPMIRGAVERLARAQDHTVVSSELLDEVVAHAPHGRRTQRTTRWTEAATARLERVPDGFMRRVTRERVEAFAQAQGLSLITDDTVEAKLAGWADKDLSLTMFWESEALARLHRIPASVRGAVAAEIEARAQRRGLPRVSAALLSELRRAVASSGVFHSDPPAPVLLPDRFIAWQCRERRQLFDGLLQGVVPSFMASHLPVLASLNPSGASFPLRVSTKGVGLLPRPEHLPHYLQRLRACLDRCGDPPSPDSLAERIEVARALYDHPEHVARDALGSLEIFEGQTWSNLQADPRASLLYTGPGPHYLSYQLDCQVEVLGGDDPVLDFLRGMRALFEHERFHLPQPPSAGGYRFRLRELHDKTPFSRRG